MKDLISEEEAKKLFDSDTECSLWIKRDITSAIAEYLYEKGFKK